MGHTYLKKLFYICTENLKDEQTFRHTALCAYSFHEESKEVVSNYTLTNVWLN